MRVRRTREPAAARPGRPLCPVTTCSMHAGASASKTASVRPIRSGRSAARRDQRSMLGPRSETGRIVGFAEQPRQLVETPLGSCSPGPRSTSVPCGMILIKPARPAYALPADRCRRAGDASGRPAPRRSCAKIGPIIAGAASGCAGSSRSSWLRTRDHEDAVGSPLESVSQQDRLRGNVVQSVSANDNLSTVPATPARQSTRRPGGNATATPGWYHGIADLHAPSARSDRESQCRPRPDHRPVADEPTSRSFIDRILDKLKTAPVVGLMCRHHHGDRIHAVGQRIFRDAIAVAAARRRA